MTKELVLSESEAYEISHILADVGMADFACDIHVLSDGWRAFAVATIEGYNSDIHWFQDQVMTRSVVQFVIDRSEANVARKVAALFADADQIFRDHTKEDSRPIKSGDGLPLGWWSYRRPTGLFT